MLGDFRIFRRRGNPDFNLMPTLTYISTSTTLV